MWLRSHAADLAEWVAPEISLNPFYEPKPFAWRRGAIGFVAVAAIIMAALWVWDASAGMALPGARASYQAGAGGF